MVQENRQSYNGNGPHGYFYRPLVDAPYAMCPGCDDCPEPVQAESAYDEPPDPTRLWCERHQTWLGRREKNGNVWYSHKTHEGWCRRAAK